MPTDRTGLYGFILLDETDREREKKENNTGCDVHEVCTVTHYVAHCAYSIRYISLCMYSDTMDATDCFILYSSSSFFFVCFHCMVGHIMVIKWW